MIQSVTYLNGTSKEKIALEAFLTEWSTDNLTYSIHTSGSTGTPRLIELKKNAMRKSAKATLAYFSVPRHGRAFLCLPLSTIGGVMMVVRAIENEMDLIVAPVKAQPFMNNESIGSIDLAAMVPTQLSAVAKESPSSLRKIKYLLVGGAPVETRLIDLLSKEKITVYQTFGMTETISHVAVRKIGHETDEYYEALPNIRFTENENQLVIHYPEISNTPIVTKESIVLKDAFHFKWLGRTDLVINSGGKKIYPEVVEKKLESVLSAPFFIAGIPDEYWGEMVVLVLCNNKTVIPSKKELIALGLEAHELPKRIFHLNEFKFLPGGKLDRISTINQINTDEYTALI